MATVETNSYGGPDGKTTEDLQRFILGGVGKFDETVMWAGFNAMAAAKSKL